MTDAELITVHVSGLPLATAAHAREHNDELTRELTLVGQQMRRNGNTGELPARLVALVEQLTVEYTPFTAEQQRQLDEAIAAGLDTIDLTYTVPPSAAGAAKALGDILDEADDYCRDGRYLLTLASPPELVTYRRWFLEQFTNQAQGHEPVTWADYGRGHGAES